MPTLPIENVLPELRLALASNTNAVLSADPGAGKTTRVPVALLNEPWLSGKKIIMLEPRRLAAQRAAAYMAQQRGEKAGETIGYRIRGESRVSSRTRIEVVTEGILTRMLQSDQSLPEVGLVIFDEFHERSLHADLGLAFTLDTQQHLRNDLRILVMSATLDGLEVSALLGSAPVIKSEGRAFPVETFYAQHEETGRLEQRVAAAIVRAVREQEGDVLVFLPGRREIRRVDALLLNGDLSENVSVHMLYGEAPPDKQQAALTPARKGSRKVILSTSIAETSLTIDGVQVVIDSGFSRSSSFNPRRGMSGLVTTPASQSSADQRRGRAGRQQPGVCYRLWTERQHVQLPRFPQPEISVADLAPLALELACWGDPKGETLRFLTPPPSAHLSQARELLQRLGALDGNGALTSHGKAMEELAVHPRLAHMLVLGKELGFGALACDVAALLEEADLLRGGTDADIDLFSRWLVLRKGGEGNRFAVERARSQVKRLRGILGILEKEADEGKLGLLLALAYPERVGKRRENGGLYYQLAGGTGAVLPQGSLLAREPYLAIGDVDGVGNDVRVFLAAPLSEADIRTAFADQLQSAEEVLWDEKTEAVIARRVTRFGAIELAAANIAPEPGKLTAALIDGIRQSGIGVLPWTRDAESIRERSEWLCSAGIVRHEWPDLSDTHLTEILEHWLAPYLQGSTSKAHLKRLDMSRILRAQFSHTQLSELERLAPTHLTVPTGSRIPLDYSGPQPVLAVRLQELFGEPATPTVGGGKTKVVLHLLSPAHRPLAVTQDLPSFWKNAYIDVRKDMRGRYPKHYWPENPLE
ncbi:MAG: ATP-dependent helicase HrpB, partial [Bacteroidetes bacterium]|nr:ATP-dependent helicase HrpB [Bacteroidota bacterium]